MFLILLFLLGLVFGSFINAWVWRTSLYFSENYPSKKNTEKSFSILHGRSICPSCEHELSWVDLIPVFSWMLLKGKCRYCKRPISIQYPVVEAVTALAFVLSWLLWPFPLITAGEYLYFALWLSALVSFVALVSFDFKYMVLPNAMVLPAFIASIASVLVLFFMNEWFVSVLANAAFASIVFGGFFYALFQFSDGRWIGGGDVKLAFVLGLWLPSVFFVPVVLFLSSVFGLLFVLFFGVRAKEFSLKAQIPYGPMLIFALILVFLLQESVASLFAELLYFDI